MGEAIFAPALREKGAGIEALPGQLLTKADEGEIG
jgi:hypothetical protein